MSDFNTQKIFGLDRWRQDPWLHQAAQDIETTYGDQIEAVGTTLTKFGENEVVGTADATIMTLGSGATAEAYVSSNLINQISSSSASDTGTVVVEGHTVSSGIFTFVSQTVTLTGQTAASLGTALARVQRVYNSGASVLVGDVYVTQTDTLTAGVPDTAAKIHCVAPLEDNQSLKAASTTSDKQYLLISGIYAAINDKTAAAGVVRLSVRNKGGVFRTQIKRGIASQGASLEYRAAPFIIVPPNSDIKMSAEADGANTAISSGYSGILVNAYS